MPPRDRTKPVVTFTYVMRLALAMTMVYFGARELSAQCVVSSGGLQNKGTLDQTTGIRTIRIALPPASGGSPTVNQGTRYAMEDAVAAWNAKTSTTKIHFTPVEYTDPADTMFELNNTEVQLWGALCARGAVGGKVFFDSGLDGVGANYQEEVAGRTKRQHLAHILTHELGHVMNLDHANGTIMEQASPGGSSCADVVAEHMPSVSTISDEIAGTAKICANKGDPVEQAGGGFGESEPNGECWDVYWFHVYWDMDAEGHWYIYAIQGTFLYTTCDENPYPS